MSPEDERAALLADLNDALLAWRQGDVGRPGVFVSLVRSTLPLAPGTLDQAEQEDSEYFLYEPDDIDAFVLVSQTCDVVRAVSDTAGGQRFWVQVAPLVTLSEPAASEASSGRSPRFAPVPGAGANSFADLDRCTTIEKPVLVQAQRTAGCSDDASRRAFADALGRNRNRFAFPDELHEMLKPFGSHLRKRAGRQSPEGRCVDALVQIRAEPDREWDAPGVTVTLHLIVDAAQLPPLDEEFVPAVSDAAQIHMDTDPAKVAEAIEACDVDDQSTRQALWQRLAELWVGLCNPNDAIVEIVALVASEAEFTLLQMRNAPKLELDHLSPGEAAIG